MKGQNLAKEIGENKSLEYTKRKKSIDLEVDQYTQGIRPTNSFVMPEFLINKILDNTIHQSWINKINRAIPDYVISQTLTILSNNVRYDYKDQGDNIVSNDEEFEEVVEIEPRASAIDWLSQAKVKVKVQINVQNDMKNNIEKLKSTRSAKKSFSFSRKHSLLLSKTKSVKFDINSRQRSINLDEVKSGKGAKTPKGYHRKLNDKDDNGQVKLETMSVSSNSFATERIRIEKVKNAKERMIEIEKQMKEFKKKSLINESRTSLNKLQVAENSK